MVGNIVRIKGNKAYISKYEVMEAFFRTEEEENESMANELNRMINAFCDLEKDTGHNVTILPFDVDKYKKVIEYISTSYSSID